MEYSLSGARQPRGGDQIRGRRVGGGDSPVGGSGGAMYENQYDYYGQHQQPPQPQLFEDTSSQNYGYGNQGYSGGNYGYPQGGGPGSQAGQGGPGPGPGHAGPPGGYGAYPGDLAGTQIFQDPLVANMAMQYGQTLVGQGREYVDKKLEKYVSMSQVKYYFAVDTQYVVKKLQLLFFPYTHSDWSVRYEQDEPVQPRHEINAPDLYIPLMAVVTYILVAGLCLGLQERFSPDVLGMQASSALVWLVLEIFVILATMYVTAIHTNIKSLDLLAFASYKYVGMIVALLAGLVLDSVGYYCVLAYCSLSLIVFMFRTLRWQIQGGDRAMEAYSAGNKRRLYLLLFMSGLQPLMMWWLTRHLVSK